MGIITYRSYRDGDEEQILNVYNSIFTKHQTLSQWRWAYEQNPVRRPHAILAFCDERLIAHVAVMPLVLSQDGQILHASRLQHAFVHPDFRGRGIFTEVLNRLTRDLAESAVDFALAFPTAERHSFPGILKVGYTHGFDIFEFRLDVSRGVGAPEGPLTVEIEEVPVFRTADVHFIQGELAPFAIVNARSVEYLMWRFHPDSGNAYRIVRAWMSGEQVGLAVVKSFPAGRSIDLVEFLFRNDERIVRSGLQAIHTYFQNEQPTSLMVWSMDHYPVHPCLARVGFEKGRTTHVVYKWLSSRSHHSNAPDAFYLAMGDSDVY